MNNWYKISQEQISFEAWIGREMSKIPSSQYEPGLEREGNVLFYLDQLTSWVNATKPNLNNFDIHEAIQESSKWIDKTQEEKRLHPHLTEENINKEKLARHINLMRFEDNAIKATPENITITEISKVKDKFGILSESGDIIYSVTISYPFMRKIFLSDPNEKPMKKNVTLITKDGEYFRTYSYVP